MYIFLSYICRIRLFIIIFVVETALASSIMALNNTDSEEIIYAVCIMFFVAFAVCMRMGPSGWFHWN